MGYAACEPPYGLHLLGLPQLPLQEGLFLLGLLALGYVPEEVQQGGLPLVLDGDHVDLGPSHVAAFPDHPKGIDLLGLLTTLPSRIGIQDPVPVLGVDELPEGPGEELVACISQDFRGPAVDETEAVPLDDGYHVPCVLHHQAIPLLASPPSLHLPLQLRCLLFQLSH